MKEKIKVFCNKCLHFEDRGYMAPYEIKYCCNHPKNYIDTWRAAKCDREKKPYERNCNNDCQWFEEIPEPIEKESWWRRLFTFDK